MTPSHRGFDHLPDDVLGEGDDEYDRRDPSPVGDTARSPLLLLTLWLFIPAVTAVGFVLFGVHLGAQYPDAWYTRAVAWLVAVLY